MEIKPKKYRRWTKESITEEINRLQDFSAKNAQRFRPELYGAAVRHFGSWKNAVGSAGLDYQKVRKKRAFGYWNEEAVRSGILALQERHSALVRKKHGDLYNAALRMFGSWENAVRACGINYEAVQRGVRKK